MSERQILQQDRPIPTHSAIYARDSTTSTSLYAHRLVIMVLDRALVIGILLFQNVTTIDYMGPASYLEYLEPMVGQKTEFYTISEKAGGPIQPVHFSPVVASVGFEDAPKKWDILIIPGGTGTTLTSKNQKYLDYTRAAAESATDVLTVCTGSRILANAGLLDGKSATTNKVKFNEIAAEVPEVNWQAQARWVVDGKYWTSSGVMAGIDLGHAYISEKYGKDVAEKMSKTMEYVPNTDPSNDPFYSVTQGTAAPHAMKSANATAPPFRIGIVLFEKTSTMDYSGVNNFLELIKFMAGKNSEVYTIAEKAGAGTNPLNMMPLFASATMETAPEKFDILLIPGGPGVDAALKNEKFMTYVRQAAEKATDVLTVATGSRILGATGLLDGKKATTSKMELGKISTELPKVQWEQQARWVVDGKWWTSSGSASGMDMGRAYISAKYGEELAARLADLAEYTAILDPAKDPFAAGAKPVTPPAPSSGAPAPSSLAPAPISGTPASSSAAPTPSSAAPAVSSAAPVASSAAPTHTPWTDAPAPSPSSTTAPGTPAPSTGAPTELPGVVKPNPGATTCVRGSQGRKDLDAWCTSNCAMNFCPQSHCEPCA